MLEQLTYRNVFVKILNCGVNVKRKDCAGSRPFQHKLQHHCFHGKVSKPVPQLTMIYQAKTAKFFQPDSFQPFRSTNRLYRLLFFSFKERNSVKILCINGGKWLALLTSFRVQIMVNFVHALEVGKHNFHKNKRIIYLPQFMNKVYR